MRLVGRGERTEAAHLPRPGFSQHSYGRILCEVQSYLVHDSIINLVNKDSISQGTEAHAVSPSTEVGGSVRSQVSLVYRVRFHQKIKAKKFLN